MRRWRSEDRGDARRVSRSSLSATTMASSVDEEQEKEIDEDPQ